jgi:hypothetical protein
MTIHTSPVEIDANQWNDLIKNSPVASFFQTRECYDFYASLSFLEPFVFGVSENNRLMGLICGYIVADGGRLKRFFSRRAIVPVGALLHSDISAEALKMLLKHTVESLKNKAIYLEFRNFNDYSAFRSIFEQAGFVYHPHLNFHVPTANVDTVFQQLSSTKRRDVRISQREGAEIVELQCDNDIKDYYRLLTGLYKTKIKKPLFPFEFFEKIVKIPECRLFGIKYQERIIGGSICVFLKNRVVYEWFVCGLDGKYENIYPSTLATYAAIKYAAGNGFDYFDMMGAGKPDEQYNVREFKAKFGGVLVEHGRFLFVNKPFFYALGKKVIQIMKKL